MEEIPRGPRILVAEDNGINPRPIVAFLKKRNTKHWINLQMEELLWTTRSRRFMDWVYLNMQNKDSGLFATVECSESETCSLMGLLPTSSGIWQAAEIWS
jgi:hypothetical protein